MSALSCRGFVMKNILRGMLSLGVMSGAVTAWAADAVCVAMIQPAVETATGICNTFPTPCEVPKGWVPVERCFQDAYPGDRDGIWSVMPGQTDASGKPLTLPLLALRISMPTNSGAVLFLHEGAWEGYVGPFDPTTASLRITTFNQQAYNVWSVGIGSDNYAWINGEVCRDGSNPMAQGDLEQGDGSTTPPANVTSRCLIPEGIQIGLEKLL